MNTSIAIRASHRVSFTEDVFCPANPTLAFSFEDTTSPSRMLVMVDDCVMAHWPDLQQRITEYARNHPRVPSLAGPLVAVPGGETSKNNLEVLEQLVSAIHQARLCRQSYVLAIGGGATLDTAGFAASICHRGVRLVRLPTTTLSQADSGVGVKNGINAFGSKNYLGTFSVPYAVVNDFRFLETLSSRDWRAGFSEAVKVGLVNDPELFRTLSTRACDLNARRVDVAHDVIRRSAELHLQHISEGGDPFELQEARPLDFGHWAAHKLEQLTAFRLNHGEAVAIGVALDVEYSCLVGLLSRTQADAVHQCLLNLGFPLSDPAMVLADHLVSGLEEFREHLGGRLTVTLLQEIGRPVEVHQIDRTLMSSAICNLLVRHPVHPGPPQVRLESVQDSALPPRGYHDKEATTPAGHIRADHRSIFS